MWLPASSFNRTVSFQTTSRFGRKRKDKTSEESSDLIFGPQMKKQPVNQLKERSRTKKMQSLTKTTKAKSWLTRQPRSTLLQGKSSLNQNSRRSQTSKMLIPARKNWPTMHLQMLVRQTTSRSHRDQNAL